MVEKPIDGPQRVEPPRVDLKVSPQDATWSDFQATCVEADRCRSFTGVWAFDHLAPVASGSPKQLDDTSTCFEGWTAIAALAAVTEHVRLGLLVSAVPFRPVSVLAKIASTVDHVSGGRVELGLGAGNTDTEAGQFGLEFGTVRERLDALEAACEFLRATLVASPAPDAPLRLQPPTVQARIPLIVGGKGERRTLPIVAAWCDGWNYSRGTPEEFAAKQQRLAELCAAGGRNPHELRTTVQVRVDHRDVGPGRDLAFAYAAVGATDIVLYTQADPVAVGPLAAVADELRAG